MNGRVGMFFRPVRFLRRDGDRIFLDSRDLIRLLDSNEPVPATQFAAELRRRHARIVLVFTNVTELVPQNEQVRADPARVASLMSRLESLPHAFLRTPDLGAEEFRAAILAFQNGSRVSPVDPYVDHWWETMWKIPPKIARYITPSAERELLNSLTLAQQVSTLLPDSISRRFRTNNQDRLRQAMADDRARFGTRRGSREALTAAVARYIEWQGWGEPLGGIDAFVEYLLREPRACPGWRLGFDIYEEYRCNLTAVPSKNDIPDFSHAQLLPYVTHATLDRAWQVRCEQARDRLSKAGIDVSAYRRLFPDLASIIASWHDADSTGRLTPLTS